MDSDQTEFEDLSGRLIEAADAVLSKKASFRNVDDFTRAYEEAGVKALHLKWTPMFKSLPKTEAVLNTAADVLSKMNEIVVLRIEMGTQGGRRELTRRYRKKHNARKTRSRSTRS